jgi:uncharacterized membrane-anchored protein YitT (DUF2179 family)
MSKSELDKKTKQYALGSILFLFLGLCVVIAILFGGVSSVYMLNALLMLGFLAGLCFGVLVCKYIIQDYKKRIDEE